MSGDREAYACCPHCADAADDHVEHGGTVERDGHEAPCSTCEFERRIAPLVEQARADAWDEGAYTPRMQDGSEQPVGENPYRRAP